MPPLITPFFLVIAIYPINIISYSNIILLSIIMKLSYSFATIAVSLLSTTEGLQDKNLRSAVSSISKAASSSSTADADVQKHASIRHTIRSAAPTASTSPKDIQRHAQELTMDTIIPLGVRETRPVRMMAMLLTI